jgi:hypothetical protein
VYWIFLEGLCSEPQNFDLDVITRGMFGHAKNFLSNMFVQIVFPAVDTDHCWYILDDDRGIASLEGYGCLAWMCVTLFAKDAPH